MVHQVREGITYIALTEKPGCRLYRVIAKRRIPDMPSFYNPETDRVRWYSDGNGRFFLHIAETQERTLWHRTVPSKKQVTINHWFEVTT